MTLARSFRARARNAAVAFAAAAFSCSPQAALSGSNDARGQASKLSDTSHLTTLGGACVPSGLETCFDARDNDCNGLFDEGCGMPDGPLQLIIAWDNPEADVDLSVFGPDGEVANVGKVTSVGLTKDRDCPKAPNDCGGQNVEVVYLESDTVAKGTYRVSVRLEKPDVQGRPVIVQVGGHIGGQPLTGRVPLDGDRGAAHLEIQRP